MTRALATSALLTVLLAAHAAPAHACSAGERAAAVKRGKRVGPPPWVIGDSTAILATPVLGRLGIEADAQGCRWFSQGTALVARRGSRAPNAVVLALGANGGATRRDVWRARRVVGKRRFLFLVTPRNYPSARAVYLAAARRQPDRVAAVDWTAHSAGRADWFFGDGLHVNHTGARVWARLIRDELDPFFGPPRRGRALGIPEARDAGDVTPCGTTRAYGRRTEVFVTRAPDWFSCRLARRAMARPRLHEPRGWRFYDWRTVGKGPWTDVVARVDRSIVLAGITR